MAVSIIMFSLYRHDNRWVFDNPQDGYDKEPFILGSPELIDSLVKNIPAARNGFKMLLSPAPFTGYQRVLSYIRPEKDGYWYSDGKTQAEEWVSNIVLKEFEKAPPKIYVKAEALLIPYHRNSQ
jgi:Family of unknown function (DUF6717)